MNKIQTRERRFDRIKASDLNGVYVKRLRNPPKHQNFLRLTFRLDAENQKLSSKRGPLCVQSWDPFLFITPKICNFHSNESESFVG